MFCTQVSSAARSDSSGFRGWIRSGCTGGDGAAKGFSLSCRNKFCYLPLENDLPYGDKNQESASLVWICTRPRRGWRSCRSERREMARNEVKVEMGGKWGEKGTVSVVRPYLGSSLQARGSLQSPGHLNRKWAFQQLQREPGSLQNCQLWLPSSPRRKQQEKKGDLTSLGGPTKRARGSCDSPTRSFTCSLYIYGLCFIRS